MSGAELDAWWQGFAAGSFVLAMTITVVSAVTFAVVRLRRPQPTGRRYYVPYAATTARGSGFGWVDLTRDQPVRHGDDIKGIAETIREDGDGLTSVTVLGFWPFESR